MQGDGAGPRANATFGLLPGGRTAPELLGGARRWSRRRRSLWRPRAWAISVRSISSSGAGARPRSILSRRQQNANRTIGSGTGGVFLVVHINRGAVYKQIGKISWVHYLSPWGKECVIVVRVRVIGIVIRVTIMNNKTDRNNNNCNSEPQ